MSEHQYLEAGSHSYIGTATPRRTVRSFVVVQIPLLDTRSIARSDRMRLLRPDWPDPQPESEFVRSAGVVRRRRAGPIYGWDGEIAFCEATRLIKFPGSLTTDTHTFSVVYRRLFGFEYGYRLEIGFVAYSSPMRNWKDLCKTALRIPVVVNGSSPTELQNVGPDISRQLAILTTRKSTRLDFSEPDLLCGVPAIRVETNGGRKRLEAATASNQIPCFRFVGLDGSERKLRGALWRLHTELELIRCLNRLIRKDAGTVDSVKALDLVSELTSHLALERREGLNQPPLVALATTFGAVGLRDLTSLADAIRHQSLGLARRLEIAAERAARDTAIAKASAFAAGINIEILVQNISKEKVLGHKIKAHKNSVVTIDSDISGSFNRIAAKDAELHQALQNMLASIEHIQDPAVKAEAEELTSAMVVAADDGKRSVFAASWERLQKIAPVVAAGATVTASVARFLNGG